MFIHLLSLGSFDGLEGPLVHKQASFPIAFSGVRFILTSTIAQVVYLGSWALVALVIIIRFMVDQCPFLLEALTWVNNTFLFQQHFKATCDLLPPLARAWFFPFEQFIGQQMVQLQDSILEHLHHHTLSNMFFNGIFEAHSVRILSCYGPKASAWLTVWSVFPTFWLSSSIFSTTLRTWLGLPHPSITWILWCVSTHPINPMDIHLLCCVHGNECTGTHDAICNTFVAITRNASFHMGWEQLQLLSSTTFISSCWWVGIVLTKDGICILVGVVIADPMWMDLFP